MYIIIHKRYEMDTTLWGATINKYIYAIKRLISLITHAERPKQIQFLSVEVNDIICPKGYQAITLFGTVFTHDENTARELNTAHSKLMNHEHIHLRQAQDTHNSWWIFYSMYAWYYLIALPYNIKLKHAAYLLNPFEIEAYTNMQNIKYLEQDYHTTNNWRIYSRMSLRQRLIIYSK